MSIFIILLITLLIYLANGSTLRKLPKSALVIGFDRAYEQSLLAHTLSDLGIDTTLLITSFDENNIYEHLVDMEVIKLIMPDAPTADQRAINACEATIADPRLTKKIRDELRPTFVLFPAHRHDGCLLPWAKSIGSIPVVMTYGAEEDLYVVRRTGKAFPIHPLPGWTGFWVGQESRDFIPSTDSKYLTHVEKLINEHVKKCVDCQKLIKKEKKFKYLYSEVELIFRVADPILRTDFARITEQPIDVGCHHCRGAHPLPAELQKELVDYRLGVIVVTLGERHTPSVLDVALTLRSQKRGVAIAWKTNKVKFSEEELPEHLYITPEIDRQDLIGYARARVLLSHCEDLELLEAMFHGTPIICFPTNYNERKNTFHAIELGIAVDLGGYITTEALIASIEKIHSTAKYRENARDVSMLIRDRPMPPSDKILYWLEWAARNSERSAKLPDRRASDFRTLDEDTLLYTGATYGGCAGAMITVIVYYTIHIINVVKAARLQERAQQRRWRPRNDHDRR